MKPMTEFQGELTFGRVSLSFMVPHGAEAVQITGTTVTKGFLYAAAYDSHGHFRGKVLFEKAHKSLNICAEQSGFGAIDGDLAAGKWSLELYNLEGEFRSERAMQYQVNIAFEQPVDTLAIDSVATLGLDHQISFDYSRLLSSESRWYRGDLHAHTQLSDGHNTLAAAKQIVEAQGLDFFFLTEHNICQPRLPLSEQCLFMPALEVTTDLGHFNVHGPQSALDLRHVEHSSQSVMQAGLALANASHSSISVNHPMMKPWHWQYAPLELDKVSTFEVCCDPTWSTSPKATNSALNVLNEMWNCGHRISAIGGSDSHLEPHERNPKATEPSLYGDPSTFVFSHGLCGEGILAGLRNGHVYLERRCGLSFAINGNELLPGCDSKGQALCYQLAVDDDEHTYYAECIVDGVVVAKVTLHNSEQMLFVEAGYSWCRIDIRRAENDEFEGCINAVYDGDQPIFTTPLVKTWGELMERFNSDEV